MSERAKVFPYTKSSCLLSTEHAFCGKCCVYIASDPCNNLVCVWRSLLLSHFTDEGAKARVLHSRSPVFIKIFMVGPTACWACVGKRGSQPETHPSWVIPGLWLCCPLFLALHAPVRRWAPHQCLVRARRWTELTNQGDDDAGDGILGAELDPRLEAEPLGLP